MFLAVAVPAVVVGVIAWFYLPDRPADAKWLTAEEAEWLTTALEREASTRTSGEHGGLRTAFTNGRVWTLCVIYFGFIYGLYALAFFLPTIISGFEAAFGTKFGFVEKGLITAIPYLPAAIFLYFWSKDAERRGVRTWHIAGPAVVGGLSIPVALFMGSPAATVAVITVTACAIFAALPNFWTIPSRFLTGAAAAAGIALINTFGNVAGFAAGYVTGWLKDASGSYVLPMFVVGGLMLVSAVLMVALARRGEIGADDSTAPAAVHTGH
jgi:predicted MFS family arabinose efflux permease